MNNDPEMRVILTVAFVMFALAIMTILLTGCAHAYESLACAEACARRAVETGHNLEVTGWRDTQGVCGCRFDDGTISYTCQRPVQVAGICQWSE